MSVPENQKDILSSWKEIADYLNCGVRTCQRWEKESELPVHRLLESSRARVFAYKKELDRWLSQSSCQEQKSHWKSINLLILVLVLVVLFFLLFKRPVSSEPNDFRIEGSELVILNKQSQELWRYETGIVNLRDEEFYRNHFQVRKNSEHHDGLDYPFLIIRDIDNDKKKEVLFIPRSIVLGESKERLICLDSGGKTKRWFEPGRTMTFGEKTYSNKYTVKGLGVTDLNQDNLLEIFMISNNMDMFPTQLAVLDHSGKLQREYWNSGRIHDFSFCDLDKDGGKEILLGGCNNEYDKGFLAVLEPDFRSGGSPQNGYYKSPDLAQGVEKHYILFPVTDFGKVELMRDPIIRISIIDGKAVSTSTRSGRIFEFDFNFILKEIRFTDRYETLHNEAFQKNLTRAPFSPRVMAEAKSELMTQVLCYDGEKWIQHPVMANSF